MSTYFGPLPASTYRPTNWPLWLYLGLLFSAYLVRTVYFFSTGAPIGLALGASALGGSVLLSVPVVLLPYAGFLRFHRFTCLAYTFVQLGLFAFAQLYNPSWGLLALPTQLVIVWYAYRFQPAS